MVIWKTTWVAFDGTKHQCLFVNAEHAEAYAKDRKSIYRETHLAEYVKWECEVLHDKDLTKY